MTPALPRRLSAALALLLAAAPACGGAPTPPATTPTPTPPATGAPDATAPAATGPAATAPLARATKVRTVEGITEYRLGNGLQVLLFPDATKSTVTVNITYFVGSRVEGYGETGMAHLLEHMAFKGTPTHRNVLKLLDERGAFANGTTWTDRTNYFETLPATGDNLAWALGLEADRMVNCSILPEDLATEFSVVRNEFEIGENDPAAVLEERMVSTAYLWHNYGKSTIGSRSDIERVPVERLRAFYERYYQPDNAMLVVAGKLDEKATLAAIEQTFGTIPRPTRALPASYTVEPVQDGERSVTLRRNGDVTLVAALYHAVAGSDPDFPAVQAAVDILTREPSGRLYRSLVESKLAASVSGVSYRFKDPTFALIGAEVRDGKLAGKVRDALLAGIEGLGASKITDEEVNRFKNAALKNLELNMAESQDIAVALSEWASLGDWRLLFAWRDRVAALTAADVRRVAATYFKPANRTLGEFVPTKAADRAPLPPTPDVAAIVRGIDGGEATSQGEAFTATIDNLETRIQRRKIGGLDAALLAKKTRGGKVRLQLTLHVGDATSLKGKATIAELTAALAGRGTTAHSFQQLEDLEDQLKAEIGLGAGLGTVEIDIEALRDQLPAVIDLVAEVVKTPSFPAAELEVVRQQFLAALEQQLEDPQARTFTEMQRTITPWPEGDVRRTLTPAEKIAAVKKVTVGEIKAFHRDFWGAGKGELVIVGDFDAAAVTARLERHFAGWTAKKPVARLVSKYFGALASSPRIDLKDKEMATLAGGHQIELKQDDADYAALLMASQVFGGGTGSRLWMRLREAEGLSYGTAGWAKASALDNVGSIGVFAFVAPQNLVKARAALLEELARFVAGGVTEDELAKAKASWLQQEDNSLADDGFVAGRLGEYLFLGRTLDWERQLRARVAAVTVADVARVAKKYYQPERLILVEGGDLTKAATVK